MHRERERVRCSKKEAGKERERVHFKEGVKGNEAHNYRETARQRVTQRTEKGGIHDNHRKRKEI